MITEYDWQRRVTRVNGVPVDDYLCILHKTGPEMLYQWAYERLWDRWADRVQHRFNRTE